MSEKWSQIGAKLWDEAQPGPGTLAEAYLKGRGIRLASWPAALRFHPAADYPKLKQKFPALIAQVVGAPEASFQFTYLSAEGKGKAAIDKEDQRRTLGSNKGGVVFLTDDIQPGATLLVGEGVESVASAMQASGLPGVAVLGIGGLANVEFSPDVVEIVVLGESGAGMAAKTRGVTKAKRENGKELAGELSCRACGRAMRIVHRLAGRSLRRLSRRARRGRAASRDPQRQVARFQSMVKASFLRRARRLAVQRRDVERDQDHRSKSALRRRPARGLLALSELGRSRLRRSVRR
jgi:hypothetical protein